MIGWAYFARRLLLIIPTFIGITLVCFLLVQFVPGGPVERVLQQMKGYGSPDGAAAGSGVGISEAQRKAIEAHFGFDKPFYQRYWTWLVDDRIGMRMRSYRFPNKTAWELIAGRFQVSLIFGVTGFLLSYLICIPLGILKALYHQRMFDWMSSLVIFIGYAIPAFAFGMLLKMLFAGTTDGLFDWFPAGGFYSDGYAAMGGWEKICDRVSHMFLPILCYMIGHFAVLTLLMKNALLEQIGKDYIRCVLAKGGSYGSAIRRHAFRNALIPIATGFGGILTVLFAGSVIIEQVFEIPGMGRLSLESIVGRDYPVFMGILSLSSLLGLLGNIVSDFACVCIDPRIQFNEMS
ncbi:MAG: peptide ABC transporter permease [Deltaproteobacteria bacterium]|nr:MAG: peptide ABC transporter permease [Deltaproteobacteria bacterium]